LRILLSLLITLTCQPVLAQSTSPIVEKYPATKPGAGFTFVDGAFLVKCNHWKVIDRNTGGLIVSTCGDYTMYVTAENGNPVRTLNARHETVAQFVPYYPDTSFPLFVGKKWTGKYNGQEGSFIKWSGELDCAATAFEPVQVAAGKYEAYRIECSDKWDAGIIFMHGIKKSTRWYAPSVNMIIKSVNADSKWNYELAGIDQAVTLNLFRNHRTGVPITGNF